MAKTMKKNKSRSRRRLNYGLPKNVNLTLPSRFPRPGRDMTTISAKGVIDITSSVSGFSKGKMWVFPRLAGVPSLASAIPRLDAFAKLYSRFIVSELSVRIVPAVSVLDGSTWAVNYEPALNDIPTTSGDPTNLNDVVISMHHALTTQTAAKGYSCRPIDYYGDWRSTDIGSVGYETQNNQGLVQWYTTKTDPTPSGVTIGRVEVTITISFCGLRQFGNE